MEDYWREQYARRFLGFANRGRLRQQSGRLLRRLLARFGCPGFLGSVRVFTYCSVASNGAGVKALPGQFFLQTYKNTAKLSIFSVTFIMLSK